MAANFGKDIPEPLLEMWLDLLGPYSSAHVQEAVKAVIQQYQFKTIPPFAVLKEALDDLTGTSESSLAQQALAEWGVLLREIERIGVYEYPKLHQTTAYVVRIMGGWETVCSWVDSSLDFKRKEFIQFWVASHGKVENLQLGAEGVVAAIGGRGRKAKSISNIAGVLPHAEVAQ